MPAGGYTLSSLRAELGEEVQDESFEHYTATIIRKRINNRMADFTLRSLCRRYTWRVDIVADQVIYDLSALSPRLLDVETIGLPTSASETDEYTLKRVELNELEAEYPEWRTESSTWPERYARFTQGFHGLILHPPSASSQSASVRSGTLFASQNTGALINLVGLGTAAATAAVGAIVGVRFLVGNMRIDGVAQSTDLSADSDTLEAAGIPIQWQSAIKAGVLADLFGDINVPIAMANRVPELEAEYEAAIVRAKSKALSNFQRKPAQQVPWGNF